ncbi:unnamed protein product [[Candida] boidinii]|nr:unnamed protein product [[Candida] boidinii]
MISFLNNNFTNLKINDKEKLIISNIQSTATINNNIKVYNTNNKIFNSKYSIQNLNQHLESQSQSQSQSQSTINKVLELNLPDQLRVDSPGPLDITTDTSLALNEQKESSCNLLDLLKDSDQLGNILDTSHLFNSFNSFELIDIFHDNQAIVRDPVPTEKQQQQQQQQNQSDTSLTQTPDISQDIQSLVHPDSVTVNIAKPPRDNINFDYQLAFNSHRSDNLSINNSLPSSIPSLLEKDKDFKLLIIKKNSLNSINNINNNNNNNKDSNCDIEDNQSIPSSLIYNYNLANLYTNLGTPNIKKRKNYNIINTNKNNKINKKIIKKKSINLLNSNLISDTKITTTNNNIKDEQRIEINYDKYNNDNNIIYNTNNNINKIKNFKYFKRWDLKNLKIFNKKKPVNNNDNTKINDNNELSMEMETKSLNAIINTSNTINSFKILKKNFTNIYYSLTNKIFTKLKDQQLKEEEEQNFEFNEYKDLTYEYINNTNNKNNNKNESKKFQLILKFDDHLKSLKDLFINNEDTININTSKLRYENNHNDNNDNDNDSNHSEFSFQRTAYSDFSPLINKD